MEFGPFLLEQWLEKHEHTTRFDLASSTGPPWTARELLGLMTEVEKEQLFGAPLTYRPSGGTAPLRRAVAAWLGVDDADVQVGTGASEALLSLFFLASVESSLAILREQIVEADAALKLALAGAETTALGKAST